MKCLLAEGHDFDMTGLNVVQESSDLMLPDCLPPAATVFGVLQQDAIIC